MRHAKDCKCANCGKQAEVFFGMADPDAEQTPLCRKCCDEEKMRIYQECAKIRKKYGDR